ncbi:hypothetical protein DL93DRAFT_2083405 [Clavulina sp. PMI_390]|nr:hypothetical protein DL93DRAFT_2083405 [Clavulina sp. PMI_390]
MPIKEVTTPYPLIDADPHFERVLRYMRASDVACMAGGTALGPALLLAWEKADPSVAMRKQLGPALRLSGFIGFTAGFLYAYQRSSLRFWGWTENKREEEKDFAELSKLAREGKPLYGTTSESLHNQGAAFRNSVFSQLKFGSVPWFNFATHPYHGVDTSKYYEGGVKPTETK